MMGTDGMVATVPEQMRAGARETMCHGWLVCMGAHQRRAAVLAVPCRWGPIIRRFCLFSTNQPVQPGQDDSQAGVCYPVPRAERTGAMAKRQRNLPSRKTNGLLPGEHRDILRAIKYGLYS